MVLIGGERGRVPSAMAARVTKQLKEGEGVSEGVKRG